MNQIRDGGVARHEPQRLQDLRGFPLEPFAALLEVRGHHFQCRHRSRGLGLGVSWSREVGWDHRRRRHACNGAADHTRADTYAGQLVSHGR